MFCPSCGKEINGNEKFCGYCGYVIQNHSRTAPIKNEKDDQIPNHFEKRAIEKQIKHEKKLEQKKQIKEQKKEVRKKHRKETHFSLKLVTTIILLFIISGGTLTALTYFQVINVPVMSSFFTKENKENGTVKSNDKKEGKTLSQVEETSNRYEVSTIDANEYFNNNSKVISKTDVLSSSTVKTEKEIKQSFMERGFTSPITFEYDMNGEYSESEEVDENNEKHPMYEMQYVTEEQNVWMIYEINGFIMAIPFSFNYDLDKFVIFSETDTLISYDSATNTFYETKPNDIKVVKVEKISADYLNQFTSEKIEELI